MGNWDQGLGAIGLIVLAVVLTVLVAIGAPMVTAKTTLELKDWIGFLGNILGAIGTLVAAYIAWRAVQRQVGAGQTAMMLDIRMREEDRLEIELHAISSLEDLYLNSFRPFEALTVAQRAGRLDSMGIVADVPKTRTTLQTHVGRQIPPLILEGAAVRFSAVSEMLHTVAEAQVRRAVGAPLTPKQENAEAVMKALDKVLQEYMEDLQKRKAVVMQLLWQHRRQIESGLVHE